MGGNSYSRRFSFCCIEEYGLCFVCGVTRNILHVCMMSADCFEENVKDVSLKGKK